MKPIRLSFTGLQSYRQEQSIDFTEVGGLGIFGIFGPTGSGKSTILDAITLSLFGDIERAASGNKGIINQREDKLFVSFEFILGDQRYLVERNYVRNKHNYDMVVNKGARLQKLGEEVEVLADKASEVTEKIKLLLGMEYKDFTRAVIIPQNKFDQFLRLTESDRAKMLEKIFCLEVYGELLTDRTKRLDSQVDHQLNINEKIMLELGDVSEAVCKIVEKELLEIKSLLVKKDNERTILGLQLKEMEQLVQIYAEMNSYIEEKEILEKKRPEIEIKRRQLFKAKKSEPLRNPLNQLEELKERKQKEERDLLLQQKKSEEAQTALITAKKNLDQAIEGQKESNKIKEKEYPKISLAKSYEDQINMLNKEIHSLYKRVTETKTDLEKINEEIEIINKQKGENEKSIYEYENKKKSLTHLLNCRVEVYKCADTLALLKNEEKQLKEASYLLQKKEDQLKKQEENLREGFLKNKKRFNMDTTQGNIFELVHVIASIIEQTEAEHQKSEAYLLGVTEADMAYALTLKLKEGKPCPVCGSIHHPSIAKQEASDENQISYLKEQVKKSKEELESLKKWSQDMHIQFSVYENIQEEIDSNLKPGYLNKEASFTKVEESFVQEMENLKNKLKESNILPLDRDTINVLKMKEEIEKAYEEYEQVNKTLENLQSIGKTIQNKIYDLRGREMGKTAEIKNTVEMIGKQEKKMEEYKLQLKELIGDKSSLEFENRIKSIVEQLQKELDAAQLQWDYTKNKKQEIDQIAALIHGRLEKTIEDFKNIQSYVEVELQKSGFEGKEELKASLQEPKEQQKMEEQIQKFENDMNYIDKNVKALQEKTVGQIMDFKALEEKKKIFEKLNEEYQKEVREEGILQNKLDSIKQKQKRWEELEKENLKLNQRKELISKLLNLLRGKRFVKFLAEEQLRDMVIEASIKLGELTGQRYALELDDNSSFIMRDDYSSGERRPVYSLSGGEIFLTSLSLALALSSKIQLKGSPLGFFFLDEGFGTLDPEKLELVMNVLEKIQKDRRMVGIISHVGELRNRMPRYLEVTPAKQDGTGSNILIREN
jgi:DNA repair protein SbcC/Rad50